MICDFSCLFLKGPALTKEHKEALRQKELKQIKAKYGLQVSGIWIDNNLRKIVHHLWQGFTRRDGVH